MSERQLIFLPCSAPRRFGHPIAASFRFQTVGSAYYPATYFSHVESERSSPAYARKLAATVLRRGKEQSLYVEDVASAARRFLAFDQSSRVPEERLVEPITLHPTPVASGTVARTRRIPIEKRAEAAMFAWLRHQMMAYDSMLIPPITGKRRAGDDCSHGIQAPCWIAIAVVKPSKNVSCEPPWLRITARISLQATRDEKVSGGVRLFPKTGKMLPETSHAQ